MTAPTRYVTNVEDFDVCDSQDAVKSWSTCHGKVEGLPLYDNESDWHWEKLQQLWQLIANQDDTKGITVEELRTELYNSAYEFIPDLIRKVQAQEKDTSAQRRTQYMHAEIHQQVESLLKELVANELVRVL